MKLLKKSQNCYIDSVPSINLFSSYLIRRTLYQRQRCSKFTCFLSNYHNNQLRTNQLAQVLLNQVGILGVGTRSIARILFYRLASKSAVRSLISININKHSRIIRQR